MSDNLDPISPSEATQILSNSRWNRDESSEDFLTGKRGVEASQGFSEMPLANPITKEADEPIDSADLRPLREEAQEIPAPTPINYHQQGGEHAGQPMDDRLTVSAEQAAADIARYREGVGEQIEALEAQQIRETIDALRAGDQQQPQAPAEPVALDKQIPAARKRKRSRLRK